MKVEVGKFYRDARGRVWGPMRAYGVGQFYFGNPAVTIWRENGLSVDMDRIPNLVAEVNQRSLRERDSDDT